MKTQQPTKYTSFFTAFFSPKPDQFMTGNSPTNTRKIIDHADSLIAKSEHLRFQGERVIQQSNVDLSNIEYELGLSKALRG